MAKIFLFLPFFLLAAVLFGLLLMPLRVFMSMKGLEGRAVPDISDFIDEGLRQHERLLFYFYSPYCAPCQQTNPIIDALAARHPNVVKVDVQQTPELARRFAVAAIPASFLVQEGRVAKVLVGGGSAKKLEDLLQA